MSHQLLQRLKVQCAEATSIPSTCFRRIYDISMHRTQMLQQVCLLFKHRHAQTTRKRFFSRMHPQMRFQIPRHTKLLATVFATIFPHRCTTSITSVSSTTSGTRHRGTTTSRIVGHGLMATGITGIICVTGRMQGRW